MNDTTPRKDAYTLRLRLGLAALILGFAIFVLGAIPARFGVDRSQVTGFVQISVFLFGLAIMCVGGYVSLNTLWNGQQKTILADIGIRLAATGYVIAVSSGLADIFGFGSHPFPAIPSFGTIQVVGVILGEATIALGFLLFTPNPRRPKVEPGG
jgi:hypothetical protein